MYLKFILYYLDLSSIQRTKKTGQKYIYDLFTTNWYYSYKLGIVFAMYQRMRSKGASWYGPRILLGRRLSHPSRLGGVVLISTICVGLSPSETTRFC